MAGEQPDFKKLAQHLHAVANEIELIPNAPVIQQGNQPTKLLWRIYDHCQLLQADIQLIACFLRGKSQLTEVRPAAASGQIQTTNYGKLTMSPKQPNFRVFAESLPAIAKEIGLIPNYSVLREKDETECIQRIQNNCKLLQVDLQLLASPILGNAQPIEVRPEAVNSQVRALNDHLGQ
ncbi:hypothetical protein HOY80DRAFT_1116643 [Tuber brumale]|nr:hypothetical protein HOY80DRAFT_1116643 [Tuber brumale]